MTQDDVINMAAKAGFRTGVVNDCDGKPLYNFAESIGTGNCMVEVIKLAELSAAAEREACAGVIAQTIQGLGLGHVDSHAMRRVLQQVEMHILARGKD